MDLEFILTYFHFTYIQNHIDDILHLFGLFINACELLLHVLFKMRIIQ